MLIPKQKIYVKNKQNDEIFRGFFKIYVNKYMLIPKQFFLEVFSKFQYPKKYSKMMKYLK